MRNRGQGGPNPNSHFTYVTPTTTHLSPQEALNRERERQRQQATDTTSHPNIPNGGNNRAPVPSSSASGSHPFDGFAIVPRIVWNIRPMVMLKLRKCFYPLGVTRLTLGANIDAQTRNVMFTWSWKDRLIGGRIEFQGNQLCLTKRVNIDKRTKLDLRFAFDIETRRSLFSICVLPFHGITANHRPAGLSVKQNIKLDKRLSLDVQGRVTLPEARFSTDTRSAISLGEGDFVVDLERLDFRFLLE